jgi:OmcA/MtrC family decaheme c-type cytochrome
VRTSSATALNITIDKVTINSAPVVELTVKDESGIPLAGLTTDNLRFVIAKLMPGTNGDPSAWQNYINNSDAQGTYENKGTLEDMGNGHFKYTFATDITDPAATGGITYEPSLTHRVAIQVEGFAPTNPIYDFRPSDGATTGLFSREIVKIDNCNECHNKLAMHGGGRIETKFCVTCHNPGSSDPDTGNTVDFKVMVHKIHRGEDLPSVVAGGSYQIIGYKGSVHDFSDVKLPQDIRNCTKCHDGSDADTPEGDNWETKLSMQACGSCHDDIDFSKNGVVGASNYDPDGHPGGIMTDNSECITCHSTDKIAGSVAERHSIPEQLARANFKFNILKICGVAVGTDPGPVCAPGDTPTVTFSVTNPNDGDARYAISGPSAPPEITGGSLSMLVAWDTRDYRNTDNTDAGVDNKAPASASSISISGAVEGTGADAGTYTVTAGFVVPNGAGPTGYTAEGSGAVAFQGRLVADFDGDTAYGGTLENGDRERIYPKSQIAYFRIDDAKVVARRDVVDNDKCNKCHEQVSLHGGNRNGEVQVCVLCHNPNNTDLKDRPKDGAGGIDVTATVDGKREESIDFKRFIHGIHAGAQKLYDKTPAHGFREYGLTVGDGGHDFSDTRFPGILNDCETCHLEGTYTLAGDWELPTQNDILSSTTDAAPTSTDTASVTAEQETPADDLNISPTAAVCSSCHDGLLEKTHMTSVGGAVFDTTQSVISATVIETCAVCHGPGSIADVEVVHASSGE